MDYIDGVSSEGGPLLFADAKVAQSWRGADEDGSDYDRACQVFTAPEVRGGTISIGQHQGIVWDLEGTGTADVFMTEAHNLVAAHAWLDDSLDSSDELEAVREMAELPLHSPVTLGELLVESGVLAILWSPESGECIETIRIRRSQRPTGDLAIGDGGLLVKMARGTYFCYHDEVQTDKGQARRCHLLKQAS